MTFTRGLWLTSAISFCTERLFFIWRPVIFVLHLCHAPLLQTDVMVKCTRYDVAHATTWKFKHISEGLSRQVDHCHDSLPLFCCGPGKVLIHFQLSLLFWTSSWQNRVCWWRLRKSLVLKSTGKLPGVRLDGGTKCSPYAAALMFKGSLPFYMDEVDHVLLNLHLIDISLVSKHFKIAAFKKNTFSYQFWFDIRFILAYRIIFSFSPLCFSLAVIWQLPAILPFVHTCLPPRMFLRELLCIRVATSSILKLSFSKWGNFPGCHMTLWCQREEKEQKQSNRERERAGAI